jgi:NTP pyrophosphatase (non-canonical NTP hydrolase)
MMNNMIEFHKAFKLPYNTDIKLSKHDRQVLHFDLMMEELLEFKEAYDSSDMIEIADALGDILFVLLSTVIENGLQDVFYDIFMEICRSNMSKLDKDGNPIYREDGKVMKSELFSRPNISSIIENHIISCNKLRDSDK